LILSRIHTYEPALSPEEFEFSLQSGKEIVDIISAGGCNIIGFGEMGIGNTSSASLIMSKLFKVPIQACIGRGTGVNDNQLAHKLAITTRVYHQYTTVSDPYDIARTFGGLEIAQMIGAMKAAFEHNMILLIDGFIATVALSVLVKCQKSILQNCIFCHVSNENAHQYLLQLLDQRPILNLGMRVGEGTGCAVAFPIIQSAVHFLNDMASFQDAQLSNKLK
jgi:nicotinate-nucleotide--dimethylbenzimidazole phosphoribosyltransferase